jgi:uncharacterized membrane protein
MRIAELLSMTAAAGAVSGACGQGAELIIIPRTPANRTAIMTAISADGMVVVGREGGTLRGVRWHREDGFGMFPLPPAQTVYNCSGDGSYVVGSTGNAGVGNTAYRWGPSGVELLIDSEGNRLYSAYAISDDGRVILGDAVVPSRRAAFWTMGEGLTLMPPLPGGLLPSWLSATNADGTVFAGVRIGAAGQAFRWSAADGYTMVGNLGGDIADASANGINATGEIIVGDSVAAGGGRPAYIWTPYHGMERLPLPTGDVRASAMGCSADGRVVVGQSVDASNRGHAMMYTQGIGAVRLEEYLNANYGFHLASGSMYKAMGVSSDGRTIMGGGGSLGYWVLVLPSARPADFNVDEFVDFLDLSDFLDCFNGESVLPVSSADFNRDGFTDFFDLLEFLDNF